MKNLICYHGAATSFLFFLNQSITNKIIMFSCSVLALIMNHCTTIDVFNIHSALYFSFFILNKIIKSLKNFLKKSKKVQ